MSTTNPQPSPPPFHFSKDIFAKLSPHTHLRTTLLTGRRPNGRTPSVIRHPAISLSPLSFAHGSAALQIGATSVVCAVRADMLPVSRIPHYRRTTLYDKAAAGHGNGPLIEYGLITPNVHLENGCAPEFPSGAPPGTATQALTARVSSLIHSCRLLHAEQLEIWHTPSFQAGDGEEQQKQQGQHQQHHQHHQAAVAPTLVAYWALNIDVSFVSYDGNAFDAAWASIMAALSRTSLPVVHWDVNLQTAVLDTAAPRKTLQVPHVSASVQMPLAVTIGVFSTEERLMVPPLHGSGHFALLADPDRAEEELCDEFVTLVLGVTEPGEWRMVALEKRGGSLVDAGVVREIWPVAVEAWDVLQRAICTGLGVEPLERGR